MVKESNKIPVNKSKLFSIPILGYALHFVDAVFRLPRNDDRIKELRGAVDALKKNKQPAVSSEEPDASQQVTKSFEIAQSIAAQLAELKPNPIQGAIDISALNQLSPVELNLKQYGLTLGRIFADKMAQVYCVEPDRDPLGWRASTQDDMESNWFAWWCQELKLAPIAHRKLWEYAWLLQELHASNLLREGVRGIGFGCGEEPIPSYLAARGTELLVTDLAHDREESKVWRDAGQHGTSRDHPANTTRQSSSALRLSS